MLIERNPSASLVALGRLYFKDYRVALSFQDAEDVGRYPMCALRRRYCNVFNVSHSVKMPCVGQSAQVSVVDYGVGVEVWFCVCQAALLLFGSTLIDRKCVDYEALKVEV